MEAHLPSNLFKTRLCRKGLFSLGSLFNIYQDLLNLLEFNRTLFCDCISSMILNAQDSDERWNNFWSHLNRNFLDLESLSTSCLCYFGNSALSYWPIHNVTQFYLTLFGRLCLTNIREILSQNLKTFLHKIITSCMKMKRSHFRISYCCSPCI